MKRVAHALLALAVVAGVAGVADRVFAGSVTLGQGTECGDERGATSAADNAGHVYVVWTDYCTSHAYLYLQTSSDGGQTFGPTATLLSSQTFDGGAKAAEDDPSIYVDTSVSPPAVYVAFVATKYFTTRTPENVYAARSTDYGASFSLLKDGLKLNGVTGGCGGGNPGECRRPVVLARGSNVYVAYSNASRSAATRGSRIFAVSTNGGSAFVETVNTTSPANSSSNRAPVAEGGVIAANGDAWVAWSDNLSRDLTGGADHYVSRTPAGVLTSVSTLSGVLYSSPSSVACSTSVSPGCTAGWYAPQADLAVDAANNLYLAYQDGKNHTTAGSRSVIRLGTCALSSATACTQASNWTAAGATVRVDDKDASAAPNDCGGTVAGNTASCIAAFPQVVAGAANRVGVSWADDRDGIACAYNHGCGWRVWYRSSSSGLSGFTNPSTRLNDHLPVSPSSDASGFRFLDGSFTGLDLNAACTGNPVAAWPESVNRTGGGTNGGALYLKGLPDVPASPASLSANATGPAKVTLTWTAVSDGTSTGYVIYRGSGGSGDGLMQVASVGNVTAYDDIGLAAGQRYTYAVSAVNGAAEGCQSPRATAALGITKVALTFSDGYDTGECSLAASPPSGDGMYDAGTVVTLTAKGKTSVIAGQQSRFDHWTGAATGSSPSVTLTLNADTTVVAHCVRQWAITVTASGVSCNVVTLGCETDPASVVTVDGSLGWSVHDVALNDAPAFWVDDGATLPYAFASTLTTTSPVDANKRYRLASVSGPGTNAPIHAAATVTGAYVVQRKVTFAQTGVGGDATGTVVSVTDGSGTTNLSAAQLPDTRFYDDGATWTFQSAVAAGTGKRYARTSTASGVIGAAQENTTLTGTYKTQYALTFGASGLGADATGTVVTVDGVPKTRSDLPFADFVDPGTSVGYVYADPVASTIGGTHYSLSGVSGAASPVTVTAASSVTGTYASVTQNQVITFPAVAAHAVNDPNFSVTATASSGLAVSFTASGNCTVSPDGATVHLTAVGPCTLTAHQSGDANWAPAPDVARTFSITKAGQTITFPSVAAHAFTDPNFSVTATASSGLAVSFTASGNCTVSADGATVHLSAAGTCTLTAHQSGDANWNAAPDFARTFNVTQGSQTITFPAVADHALGSANFSVTATASSGLPVTFTGSGSCTIAGVTVHVTAVGTCTLTAQQAGDANWNAAPDVVRTFNVTKGSQTITFPAVADRALGSADASVSASASSGLPATFTASGTCTIAGATVHVTAVGTCTLTAHQSGDANWNAAPDVARTFSVTPRATTTTLVMKPVTVKHGKTTKLTATVKAVGAKPTGVVQFTIDGTVVAQGSINAKGKFLATVNVGTTLGAHPVVAVYLGGGNFASSASAPKILTVT